jgi:hypothetical protein
MDIEDSKRLEGGGFVLDDIQGQEVNIHDHNNTNSPLHSYLLRGFGFIDVKDIKQNSNKR